MNVLIFLLKRKKSKKNFLTNMLIIMFVMIILGFLLLDYVNQMIYCFDIDRYYLNLYDIEKEGSSCACTIKLAKNKDTKLDNNEILVTLVLDNSSTNDFEIIRGKKQKDNVQITYNLSRMLDIDIGDEVIIGNEDIIVTITSIIQPCIPDLIDEQLNMNSGLIISDNNVLKKIMEGREGIFFKYDKEKDKDAKSSRSGRERLNQYEADILSNYKNYYLVFGILGILGIALLIVSENIQFFEKEQQNFLILNILGWSKKKCSYYMNIKLGIYWFIELMVSISGSYLFLNKMAEKYVASIVLSYIFLFLLACIVFSFGIIRYRIKRLEVKNM